MDVLNEGLFDVLILPIISSLAFVVGDSSRPENKLPVKRPFSPPITSSLVCVGPSQVETCQRLCHPQKLLNGG